MRTALEDAVAIHNTTPHSMTGLSPFFMMFGAEPTLPGWSKYRDSDPSNKELLRETRLRALYSKLLLHDEQAVIQKKSFNVGDWVIFWRGDRTHLEEASSEIAASAKYSSDWSLPARVLEVRDKVLIVQPWGERSSPHQVPVTKVRVLQGAVPPSLQLFNLGLLEIESPHIRTTLESARKRALPPQDFPKLLEQAAMDHRLQKRVKLLPVVTKPQPSAISGILPP